MATVFGTIQLPDLTPFTGRIGFVPESGAPVGHSFSTIVARPVFTTCDSEGFFSKAIAAGRYWVHIGNNLRVFIQLDDDTKYYFLQDLLGGVPFGVSPQNYRLAPGGIQFINGTSGRFYPVTLTGDPDEIEWLIYQPAQVLPPETYKVVSGTALFRSELDGPWHAPFLSGEATEPQMDFAPTDALITGGNFRISGSRWQLRNVTTGGFHTFFITGEAGEEAWAVGPAS